MNRAFDTRLRRLERNAPDPVEAALNALSEEDLNTAKSAVRAAIEAKRHGGSGVDMSLLPETVQHLFRAWAEHSRLRGGYRPQL